MFYQCAECQKRSEFAGWSGSEGVCVFCGGEMVELHEGESDDFDPPSDEQVDEEWSDETGDYF